MPLDSGQIIEEKDISNRDFNIKYLAQNRPCVIRGYALDWPATNKWVDKDYLVKAAGPTKAAIFTLNLN